MLFSATTILALISAVAAAPAALQRREFCNGDFDKDGNYHDAGCGTVLHPGGHNDACLSTEYETKEGSPLFLGSCLAGSAGRGGGRWALFGGQGTRIENKESAVYQYCITADADWTGVHMSPCFGKVGQSWVYADHKIRSTDRNLCIAIYGDLDTKPEPTAPGVIPPYDAEVVLEECADWDKPSQMIYNASALLG